jgi:hypothetical protein
MELLTKTSPAIAIVKKLAHARKAGVVLAAALIGAVALSSSTSAVVRADHGQRGDQYSPFNPRIPQERPGSSIDSIYQPPFFRSFA